MHPHVLTPILFGALILWLLYRRLRGNFGRQAVSVARLRFRVAVLAFVGILLGAGAAHDLRLLAALIGGAGAGAILAQFGLRHTRFEVTPAGRFYTPHTVIGLLVTALFLGRLGYRFLEIYQDPAALAQMNQQPLAVYQGSALTLATVGLLIGYYVVYNSVVLGRSWGPVGEGQDAAVP